MTSSLVRSALRQAVHFNLGGPENHSAVAKGLKERSEQWRKSRICKISPWGGGGIQMKRAGGGNRPQTHQDIFMTVFPVAVHGVLVQFEMILEVTESMKVVERSAVTHSQWE